MSLIRQRLTSEALIFNQLNQLLLGQGLGSFNPQHIVHIFGINRPAGNGRMLVEKILDYLDFLRAIDVGFENVQLHRKCLW